MRFTRKTKMLTAAVGVAALGMAGTAAFAFWTQGGTGTGSGTAGTTNNITVVQDSVSAATLYPGGPSEALSGHFDNPNTSPVNITSVTAVVSSITGGGVAPNECTPADFSIGGSSGPYTVLADDTTTWSGLTLSLDETGLNQDKCKNAVANITYTANA